MADRVRDVEDVDNGDSGYRYPLGHVLNDWDERLVAGPPEPESLARRATPRMHKHEPSAPVPHEQRRILAVSATR
jgi:hypothetical protein